MAAGFIVRVHVSAVGTAMLGGGAVLSALGAYTLAYLIWRTVDGPDALRRIARRLHDARGEQLPVLQLIQNAPPQTEAPASSQSAGDRTQRANRKTRPWGARDAR